MPDMREVITKVTSVFVFVGSTTTRPMKLWVKFRDVAAASSGAPRAVPKTCPLLTPTMTRSRFEARCPWRSPWSQKETEDRLVPNSLKPGIVPRLKNEA